MALPWAHTFDVDCTVRVSHRFEDLSAHVELDGDLPLEPGDKVLVHGPAMRPKYGEICVERRRATVTRATWVERAWTRMVGDLDCLSLLDISFTERSLS
ncbi:MAG: hypothetical protein JST00_06090 [Deltaproteobacteria bacterium]|nr:hypothetical protein [Deltaproteobacteria bacterium]